MVVCKANTNKANVAGIEITPFSSVQAAVDSMVTSTGILPGFAVAVNAEKVLNVLQDSSIKDVINKATLCYPDGISVVKTMEKKGILSRRIPGCELWMALMRKSGELKIPVFLLGAAPGIANHVAMKLRSENDVKVVGVQDGYFTDEMSVIEKIRNSKSKIVTVAMGSPRQEEFITRCMAVYPDAFYMGVGGTYDVYVGNMKRAPKWMLDWNIEWLYRLIRQPARIVRQLRLYRYIVLHVANRI